MAEKHDCPVCGKTTFESWSSFDECEHCGWTDDGVQEDKPDMTGAGNLMSLNQAKEAYKNGKRVY